MKNFKKMLSFFCIFTMMFTLFSCGKISNTVIGGNTEGEKTVYLIGKGGKNEFWQTVSKGGFYSGEKYGVKVVFQNPTNEEALDEQNMMIEKAVENGANAIILAPISRSGVSEAIKNAKSKNVKIVIIDNKLVDEGECFIGTDNVLLGREAGKNLCGLIGESGEVAVIGHNSESLSATDRVDGFLAEIGEKYPAVNVIVTAYSGGSANEVSKIVESIILENKNLSAIFATSESVCEGVMNAIAKTQKGNIEVIGVDAGKEQIKALQDGEISALLVQNPYLIGFSAVENAFKLICGEKVEKEIDTGFLYVSKENITDIDVQSLLYPLGKDE